jgi:cyanate permease
VAPGANRGTALVAVNITSTLCQTVQVGALPSLVALTLADRGMDPASIGLFATAPWLAILAASRFVPALMHAVGPSASLAFSALGYTVGAIAGPAVSGAFMQYLSAGGLMVSAGLAGGCFLMVSSFLKPKPD